MLAEHPGSLTEQTQRLSDEMDGLLKAVLPQTPDFEVELVDPRSIVRPVGGVVPLLVDRTPLASLHVSVSCCLDSRGRYLAVEESRFHLLADIDRTPIIRFDYVRNMNTRPHSHVQFHGHRGALSHLLSRAGHPTPHDVSSLHLPTGGSRFRPCLEDVVQFLIAECSFDHLADWQRHVDAGRERWRRRQVAAAVRAVPSEAVRVLEDMGYTVNRTEAHPADSHSALTRW
jgi:hypothetical protein